jgi:hypothetical protein
MLYQTSEKRLCPFINEPFDDCYCTKMSSQDIERAVCLCGSNFETCEIYKHGNGKDKTDIRIIPNITSTTL